MTAFIRKFATVVFVLLVFQAATVHASDDLEWHGWTEDLFTRAQSEKRFVILDLEAVWCHWCHVMEKETYGNSEVQEILKARYIAVRVDQDANPDLSSRYGDWGSVTFSTLSYRGNEMPVPTPSTKCHWREHWPIGTVSASL